jgi:hypothetical protein
LRVLASVVSLTLFLARSVASGTVLCAGVSAAWAGSAIAQEEANVGNRPAANTNTISFQMRPITDGLSNTDGPRINAAMFALPRELQR